MALPSLIIEGLHFSYPRYPVFSDFDFVSDAGVVVLKGPSGCGKSTLLKLVTGFFQPQRVRRIQTPSDCCLVLQEDSLFPWLSGLENISRILNIPEHEITEHPGYPVVERFVRKRAFEMSYGQRRLIEILRAILRRPTLLCLDEPLNFLDPLSRGRVVDFLQSLDSTFTRIIIATHHADEIANLDGEVYIFDGELPVKELRRER